MSEQNKPYFSIIVPVYNRSKFVVPAIESVIAQTFDNWELILVDDASTDDSALVIESYCQKDSRIKLFKQTVNAERGAARNRGIEESKGKKICFLDSDDAFCPNHLETFYNDIEKHPASALRFTNSYLLVNNAPMIEKKVPDIKQWNVFSYLLIYTPNPARVCVDREIFESFKYDPSIPGLEDIDLWLRIATRFPLRQLNEYTNIYNVHEGSYTLGDAKRYEKELKNFSYIFAKQELKGTLPFWGKRRLLSMCCFHLSQQAFISGNNDKAFRFALKSMVLYPIGYNGKTNKIALVTMVYTMPIFGNIIRNLKH